MDKIADLIRYTGKLSDTISLNLSSNVDFTHVLEYAAKHCTQLNHLKIGGNLSAITQEQVLDQHSTFKSVTLKKLTITANSAPPKDYYRLLSNRLPHLETLAITDMLKDLENTQSLFVIYIPNTLLKHLEIEMQGRTYVSKVSEAYIKLSTKSGEVISYCHFVFQKHDFGETEKFDKSKMVENLTEAAYQESIFNKKVFTCQIYCESAEKFTVKYLPEDGQKLQKVDILPQFQLKKIML